LQVKVENHNTNSGRGHPWHMEKRQEQDGEKAKNAKLPIRWKKGLESGRAGSTYRASEGGKVRKTKPLKSSLCGRNLRMSR